MPRVYYLTGALCLLLNALWVSKSFADHPAGKDVRQLVWAVNNAPPFHINNGPMQGLGICDALITATENALPELPARRLIRPLTRVGVEFERSENMCIPCLIYSESGHPGAYLSKPTHWYPPHGVITSQELAKELTEKFGNPIQLSALLQDNDYYFGYPDGRRYGRLQPLIDSFTGSNSYRVVRTGDNATTAILAMIRANRVHYTIDYSPLVTFDRFLVGSDMAFLEIAENQSQQVLGSIGCTKNEWGHAMIEKINSVVSDIRSDAAFRDRLLFWFSNQEDYVEQLDVMPKP